MAKKGKEDQTIDDILDELEGDTSKSARKQEDKGKGKADDPKRLPTPQPTDAPLIPVTAIRKKAHDTNTREEINVDDLVPSIAELGVIQPVHVIRNDDGSYLLVAGNRRLAAARKVGLEEIPAIIVNVGIENSEFLSAVENLVRKELGPLEEAKAYGTLIEKYKMTQAQVATMVGRTQQHVSQKLSLLQAPAKERKDLAKGKRTEREVRKSARKAAKPSASKRGPKPKVSSAVTIPEEDLPEGMTLSIKEKFDVEYAQALGIPRQTATLTIKVDLNPTTKTVAAVTKVVKRQAVAILNKLVGKRIDSAYKAIKGV